MHEEKKEKMLRTVGYEAMLAPLRLHKGQIGRRKGEEHNKAGGARAQKGRKLPHEARTARRMPPPSASGL